MKYRGYDQIYEDLSQQPRMKQSTANKIIFIIILIAVLPFLLVSMLFMGIGLMANHDMNKDKKVCTERVMGIVCALDEDRRVDYDSDGDRTESVTYAPVFAYSYNGRDYKITGSTYSSSPDYNEGVQVEIYVDPNDPKRIYVPSYSEQKNVHLAFIIGGGAFSLCFLLVLGISIFKLFKSKKAQTSEGESI